MEDQLHWMANSLAVEIEHAGFNMHSIQLIITPHWMVQGVLVCLPVSILCVLVLCCVLTGSRTDYKECVPVFMYMRALWSG